MSTARAVIVRFLEATRQADPLANLANGDLVRRYADAQDATAFEEIVRRHGTMLWNVCLRQVRDRADAEDLFQATLLVLARKAASIARPESLAAWLHGVAVRLATRHRGKRASGPAPVEPTAPGGEPSDGLGASELARVLHEELARLNERLRAPLILCYLEGKTRDQAAAELGLTLATLKRRLEQGREQLRRRLADRGESLSVAMLAVGTAETALPGPVAEAAVAALAEPSARLLALAAGELGRAAGVKALAWAVALTAVLAAGALAAFDPAPVPESISPPAPAGAPDEPLPRGALARLGTARLRVAGEARVLAVSPDGRRTVTAGVGPEILVYDTATGRPTATLDAGGVVEPVVGFDATGRLLAVATAAGAQVWDLATAKRVALLAEARRRAPRPGAVALSPDGKLAAVAYDNQAVGLWDVAASEMRRALAGPAGPARRLAFSPDGSALATGNRLGREGAVVGRHRVRVIDVGVYAPPEGTTPVGPPPQAVSPVQPEYGDVARTPLRDVEVRPGHQRHDLDVTPRR